MAVKEVDIRKVDFNILKEIENYALLSAGTIDNFNMMTITGFLYGQFFLKPMIQVYVRPCRYTYRFIEKNSNFVVSFFDYIYHPSLEICGNTHGNTCNKAEIAKFHPIEYQDIIVFEEAKISFICEKVYHMDVDKDNFDSMQLHDSYYYKDSLVNERKELLEKGNMYHRIYLGQIKQALIKY